MYLLVQPRCGPITRLTTLLNVRRKKHLYVQKPLTYTVHEARTLMLESRKAKIVTQMGNQGHSREGSRQIHEWVNDGAIGDVLTDF